MLKVLTHPLAGRDGRLPSRASMRQDLPSPVTDSDATYIAAAVANRVSPEEGGSTPDAVDSDGGSRSRERRLLDAWREAHWALRLRLRDLMGLGGASEVERLYDLARRADNQLNDFYRARAEEVTRRLRDLIVERAPSQPIYDDRPSSRFVATPVDPPASAAPAPRPSDADLTLSERALLSRFRCMGREERAAVLRVAQRLAGTASARVAGDAIPP